jgi:isoquinoline 1-oxidoreductase alpha subunit
MATTVNLTVNGTARTVTVDSLDMPLLWVLRDVLGLTGTKYGCGVEICGACTVIANGQAIKTCDTSVGEVAGATIMTVEGLATDPDGAKAQLAWINAQVPQCGYCQSGFLMATVAAMKQGIHGPAIAGELSNICLCGTFPRIAKAIATL